MPPFRTPISQVDASPDEVYAVLTHPDSHAIFRGIKATLERRTLADDGRGRRTLLVSHRALTRFLWLQVTFSTQLVIEEDDRAVRVPLPQARMEGREGQTREGARPGREWACGGASGTPTSRRLLSTHVSPPAPPPHM